jgi:hypothetical protein
MEKLRGTGPIWPPLTGAASENAFPSRANVGIHGIYSIFPLAL